MTFSPAHATTFTLCIQHEIRELSSFGFFVSLKIAHTFCEPPKFIEKSNARIILTAAHKNIVHSTNRSQHSVQLRNIYAFVVVVVLVNSFLDNFSSTLNAEPSWVDSIFNWVYSRRMSEANEHSSSNSNKHSRSRARAHKTDFGLCHCTYDRRTQTQNASTWNFIVASRRFLYFAVAIIFHCSLALIRSLCRCFFFAFCLLRLFRRLVAVSSVFFILFYIFVVSSMLFRLVHASLRLNCHIFVWQFMLSSSSSSLPSSSTLNVVIFFGSVEIRSTLTAKRRHCQRPTKNEAKKYRNKLKSDPPHSFRIKSIYFSVFCALISFLSTTCCWQNENEKEENFIRILRHRILCSFSAIPCLLSCQSNACWRWR